MRYRLARAALAVMATHLLLLSACETTKDVRTSRRTPVESGAGSLLETRRALEGSWTLVSLEAFDAQGARRPIKASGRLQYDEFGTMTVRGVIEDPALQNTLVLDYTGRIVIDTARRQFYSADLASDRPVDPNEAAAIAPDKVRQYELSADAFVVTYLDAAGKPTAVIHWRRGTS